jgi:hypothetical protein
MELLSSFISKKRRGAFLLREGERRDPPCMHYKCYSQKRETHSKGGLHERGELRLEEESQKWGKKTPILSLNLSLMFQGVIHGVEWATHVVPVIPDFMG